jgi:hypothetical protein
MNFVQGKITNLRTAQRDHLHLIHGGKMSDYWDRRLEKQFNHSADHIFTEGRSSVESICVYEVKRNKGIRYQRIFPNSNYESLLAIEKNYSYMVIDYIKYDSIFFYYGMDRII